MTMALQFPYYSLLITLFLLPLTTLSTSSELGKAAVLFSGPLEVVAEHPEFSWLEGPLYSETGRYLLFSDVTWVDEHNVTCGMIWKYENNKVSKFLKCSGLVGKGDTPSKVDDFIEAGSNGLSWGWKGEGDLLVCQHGKHRIVRLNVNDVKNGQIDPSKVQVVVNRYNHTRLNSPNDLYMHGNVLYFTDPHFGLRLFSANDSFQHAYDSIPQDAIGVYTIAGDPQGATLEPTRIIEYEYSDPWQVPNGVTVTRNDDVVLAITNFQDPHFDVFAKTQVGTTDTTAASNIATPAQRRLECEYRLEGKNSDKFALTDGVTYSPKLDVVFGSGPGGIYMYNGTTFELLGLLRLDDLSSNSAIGGGYLWLTVHTKLMRIPLMADDESICSID